jgi:hypothetical protein
METLESQVNLESAIAQGRLAPDDSIQSDGVSALREKTANSQANGAWNRFDV